MPHQAPALSSAKMLGGLAGGATALLHQAGALKSIPSLALAPFDITLALGAMAMPLVVLAAVTRRWFVAPAIGWPLAAIAGFWLWLLLAAIWSPAGSLLTTKLADILLLGPAMLLAGMVVAGDATMLHRFVQATLMVGALVGGLLAANLAAGQVVLGGLAQGHPDQIRVAYQVTGLAIATATGLAAIHLAEAKNWAGRGFWLAALCGLGAAALLPGGRAALMAMVLVVGLGPAVIFARRGQMGWVFAWCIVPLLVFGAVMFLMHADGAPGHHWASLERLMMRDPLEGSGRLPLWRAALVWAGAAMPFGLGLGGFSIAAGFGERRGLYPHNLGLETLAEAGLPGFLLWLMAFAGAGIAAWRLAPQVPAGQAARLLVLCLPMAVTVMVSTDLGNRMAWLALGLALGLGVRSDPVPGKAAHVRALG